MIGSLIRLCTAWEPMRTNVTRISRVCGIAGLLAVSLYPMDSGAGDAGETGPFPVPSSALAMRPALIADSGLAEVPAVSEIGHPVLLSQNVDEDDINDPLESVNRAIFAFNEVVYGILLSPIAKAYNASVPQVVRMSVSNVIDHVSSPITFVNDLLQFELDRAMTTLARFLVNTVVGFGGLADVAAVSGLEEHEEDFGQTLAVYGMGEGFYLVLPLLGPSNPRDAVGKYLVDPYFDPLGLWLDNTDRDTEKYVRIGVTAVDEYASIVDELERIRRTSVDYYAAIRSLYRQKRATEISNGREEDLPPIPNYDLNFAPTGEGSIAKIK